MYENVTNFTSLITTMEYASGETTTYAPTTVDQQAAILSPQPLSIWIWVGIGAGALVLVILIITIAVCVSKRRKTKSTTFKEEHGPEITTEKKTENGHTNGTHYHQDEITTFDNMTTNILYDSNQADQNGLEAKNDDDPSALYAQVNKL